MLLRKCVGLRMVVIAVVGMGAVSQPALAATAGAGSYSNGGFGFGNGSTITSARAQAVKSAGPSGVVIASSTSDGWCAIVRSRNARGQWIFGAAVARRTEREALTEAGDNLLRNGGSTSPTRGYYAA